MLEQGEDSVSAESLATADLTKVAWPGDAVATVAEGVDLRRLRAVPPVRLARRPNMAELSPRMKELVQPYWPVLSPMIPTLRPRASTFRPTRTPILCRPVCARRSMRPLLPRRSTAIPIPCPTTCATSLLLGMA
ncbi:MAG: hypothetical protein ACLU37_10875 [Collinsella sp.]